ncbi:molybdenum cofactor guanylyltransferase MobA [Salinisphaera sp. Q1T1-3]|uniref:molybdenum cofactor guanylyltransferase MobA n=1 Tax=Salinisphaera sp. Q1T1-3 TaxID=2321229 RepID=UPI001314FAD0|nr:molybdenum cofactor guanylyltransferase MobA [Salinisphaera sp. Q1T1-3]
MSITREQVTAGILAGGEGRRLGGSDKGWYTLTGRSLVEWTLERVGPQCGQVMISANRNMTRYQGLGWPVVPDEDAERCGPLAGIAALLAACRTPYMLFVPVDTPALPRDLLFRLAPALRADVDMAVARSPSGMHPLHALVRSAQYDAIRAALSGGVRRVTDWQSAARRRVVDWPDDVPFTNVNTPAQADALAGMCDLTDH